jgi:hypothetical protein
MPRPSQAAAKAYQGRDVRWHAFIQGRMGALEKFEIYAEQTSAELDDARSELSVEVVSIMAEVVKDAMAFLKTKRKRRSPRSTKFIAMEFATKGAKGTTCSALPIADRGQYDEGVCSAVDGQ